MAKLTAKQQRFVDEYLNDLNATQAAIRAGYSEKTAQEQSSRLLSNVMVQAAIQEAQNKRSERTEVTQDFVINTIVETINRCRQAEPVMVKGEQVVEVDVETGELRPVWKFDATNVLKGAELLGKHLGMFKDKVELSGPDGKPIQQEIMPTTIELVAPNVQGTN
jgi:phage terminase small subunit